MARFPCPLSTRRVPLVRGGGSSPSDDVATELNLVGRRVRIQVVGAQAAADERVVFERAVAQCWTPLYRFAVSLVGVNEAEDLVQDALARAWRRRESFDAARGSWRSWLLAIVADQARRRWRRRPLDLVLHGDQLVPGPESRSPVAVDVARAVDALPARQRSALILSVFVDVPVSEIAVLMACSEGTVKATLHAARRKVAEVLGEAYSHA